MSGNIQDDEQDILRRIHQLSQKELDDSLHNLEITPPPNGGNITIKADPNNSSDIQAMLQTRISAQAKSGSH
jgi:hypothetical protein